ncbi:hypothetical protein KSS87_016327 [Heliosperma pusillum]|nr:hypothetical protein KSS87_016327 [Heliosperma pusillum]
MEESSKRHGKEITVERIRPEADVFDWEGAEDETTKPSPALMLVGKLWASKAINVRAAIDSMTKLWNPKGSIIGNLRRIGAQLGHYVGVDEAPLPEMERAVRLRVLHDVRKPLRKEVEIRLAPGRTSFFEVKYERLPTYCYGCGILGHGEKDCEEGPYEEEDLKFGDGLRASPWKQRREESNITMMVEKLQAIALSHKTIGRSKLRDQTQKGDVSSAAVQRPFEDTHIVDLENRGAQLENEGGWMDYDTGQGADKGVIGDQGTELEGGQEEQGRGGGHKWKRLARTYGGGNDEGAGEGMSLNKKRARSSDEEGEKVNIAHRIHGGDDGCPRCLDQVETCLHVLRDCGWVGGVWDGVGLDVYPSGGSGEERVREWVERIMRELGVRESVEFMFSDQRNFSLETMSLRPTERTEARRSRYKVSVDADEGRRRREDNMVEIRKNRREENLLKKRREGLPPSSLSSSPASNQFPPFHTKMESLPQMVAGVYSDDPVAQLDFTTQFRKLLSIERNPPIEEVVQAGVVPRLVEFLGRDDYPQLQFEAAWALTNIASGTSENTSVVIDHGAVPVFVKLLGSSSGDVREQAVWALGNIAGDSPKCRDLVLSHGALMALLAQFNEHAKLSMLRNATWTLSNFCRGKPQPPFNQVSPALPALERLIHSNDDEILTDACWALSYLSDGTNDKIQAVIEAKVCPRLVELLLHPSPSVLIPALRTVGNIVTGDDLQTQCIIDHQSLPCLFNLLTQNHKKSIKKEACWTISNITAGTKDQIQTVIEAGIVGPLVHLLQNAEFDIKKEAAWAISNATSGGSHDQIKYMVSQGCIKPLCDLLACPDPRVVTVCLEGLENILKVGDAAKNAGTTGNANVFAQAIEEADGLEKIENLQTHDNNEIYEKAVKLLETYWVEEDEEAVPVADGSQNGFQLGGDVPQGGFKFG